MKQTQTRMVSWIGAVGLAALGIFLPLPASRKLPDTSPRIPLTSLTCSGGTSSQVDLLVEPSTVSVSGGVDQLTLRIHAADHFQEKGTWKVKYAVEITDDAGVATEPVQISDSQQLAESSAIDTDLVASKRPDGFYKVTVTVVARKKASVADAQTTFYWQVSGGRVKPMEVADWYRASPFAAKAVSL